MLAGGNGRSIDCEITGGEVHDSKMAYSLMLKIKEAGYFIANKGYDSELIRKQAQKLGMEAMILKRSNTKKPAIHFKKNIYKSRHLVENLLARLKHFRSISTRFDKIDRHFTAMIYIACAIS